MELWEQLFAKIFKGIEGFLCVASYRDIKSKLGFSQSFFRWPEQKDEVSIWIKEHRLNDSYFCPVLFSSPKRRKELALRGHALYADLDDCNPEYLGEYGEPLPSRTCPESSQRHPSADRSQRSRSHHARGRGSRRTG